MNVRRQKLAPRVLEALVVVAFCAIPFAIGVPLLFGPWLVRVLGIGAIGTGVVFVLHRTAPRVGPWLERHPRIGETIPPLLLAIATIALLWPLLLGRMPYTHDHPVHLTRAYVFVEHMLAEGRLSGWCDVWFAGWPSGDDYPMGADALIAFVYLVTFGLLGWKVSYAYAYLIAHVAWVLGPYALARVHFGKNAAFLAGLFTLLDAGSGRQWGWFFAVEVGVWPQSFATAFVFYYFASLEGLIRHGRRRDWLLTSGALAMSLVTHPFTVIWIALGFPIFVVVRAILGQGLRGPMIARSFGATGLGILLSAFWLVPFVAKAEWFQKSADLWLDLDAIGTRLITGTVYDRLFPPLLFIAIAGGLVGIRKRSTGAVWLFVLSAITLFVSSRALVVEADLIDSFGMLGRILFERFAYIVRPCVAMLAGYALAELLRVRVPISRLRGTLLAILVMFSIAPFVMPLGKAWWEYRPGRGLVTDHEQPDFPAYEEFLAWSREEQEREPRFYRIAYVDEGHFLSSAPVFNHTPAIRTDYTPATTFLFKPSRLDPRLFAVLNVKYVVSTRPLDPGNYREVRRFGRYTVFELASYSDRRATLIGPGEVDVHAFDPEHDDVRLTVRGADGTGKLVLHMANYVNWSATRDGVEVPIETGELAGQKGFLALEARDGTYELHYRTTGADALGIALTIVGLAIVLLLFLARLTPRLAAPISRRLSPIVDLTERYGGALGLAVAGLAILGVVAKLLAMPPIEERSFTSQLSRAHAELVGPGGRTACTETAPARYQCSEAEWNYVGRFYMWMLDHDGIHAVDGAIRRCIWIHPRAEPEVRVTFPSLRLGHAITGAHGLTNRGASPIELVAYANDEELGEVSLSAPYRWTPWAIDTRAREGEIVDLSFGVRVPADGPYHYCFDGEIE